MGDSCWDGYPRTANPDAAAVSVYDGYMAGPQSRPRFLHVAGSEGDNESGRDRHPRLRAFAENMAGEEAINNWREFLNLRGAQGKIRKETPLCPLGQG